MAAVAPEPKGPALNRSDGTSVTEPPAGAPFAPGPGDHPLPRALTLWFMRRTPGARTQESYEKAIRPVGSFATVEAFWAHYSHLVRPGELPAGSDYQLFATGIKPMWEDRGNRNGGKWILRLRKGLASRYWEDLVLAFVGGQFPAGHLCGVVVSVRYQEDIISVWDADAADTAARAEVHATLRAILALPEITQLEYKQHNDSLKDHSSFRNTTRS
eukprot:TRINITY_DN1882_c0_g1_i2.p2 TRINITY_DN1882_c0_g1~~TRINITY_DN1882_c0_g1_i2.p2  ORF type:complete len:234 (+),score=126.65 TRINITY_DN1882_c0_g1_i2:59-703(+)